MQAHLKMFWLQVSVHEIQFLSHHRYSPGIKNAVAHILTKELAVTVAINDKHGLRTAFPFGAAAGDLLQWVSHFTPLTL